MNSSPIAPRLVTWALIILGALEVPWIVYLMFAQQTTFEAFHLNIATLGLGISAVILSGASCYALFKNWPSAPVWCVATAALLVFLVSVTTLSHNIESAAALRPDHIPLAIAIPGVIAAVYAAVICLRGRQAVERVGIAVAAVILGLVALAFVGRTLQHFADPVSSALVTRARAIVVLLDTGEAVGLLGAGISSLRGRAQPTLVFGVMGAVLLACDAWTNVLTATSGYAFASAIFYLIVGEIPSIIVCVWAAKSAYRVVRSA